MNCLSYRVRHLFSRMKKKLFRIASCRPKKLRLQGCWWGLITTVILMAPQCGCYPVCQWASLRPWCCSHYNMLVLPAVWHTLHARLGHSATQDHRRTTKLSWLTYSLSSPQLSPSLAAGQTDSSRASACRLPFWILLKRVVQSQRACAGLSTSCDRIIVQMFSCPWS